MSEEKIEKKKRIEWLDGLKWIACFMVFFSHFYGFFYGKCDVKPEVHPALAAFLGSSYNIFINGNFWMCMFCVISGYFAYKKEIKSFKELLVALVNRYLRFFLPFLCVNFLALFIARTIGFQNEIYSAILPNAWIGEYYNFTATPWIALRASIKLSAELDCPLWMIYPLFVGTCFLYVCKYLQTKIKPAYVNGGMVVVLIVIWALPSLREKYLYSIVTVIGCFLAIIWKKRWFAFRRPWIHAIALAFVFVMIGGLQSKFLAYLGHWILVPDGVLNVCNGIYATIMLVTIGNSSGIQKVLETPIIRKGKNLSFAVYVLHWLVLSAVSLPIYGKLVDAGMEITAVFCINFMFTAVLLILLSVVYHEIAERLVSIFMKQWNNCLMRVLKIGDN